MNEINNLILDRYNPVSVAGEGGYGKVIVAWDTRIRCCYKMYKTKV